MTTEQFNSMTPHQQYYFIKFITATVKLLELPYNSMDVYVKNTICLPDAPEEVRITALIPVWPKHLKIKYYMYEYSGDSYFDQWRGMVQ